MQDIFSDALATQIAKIKVASLNLIRQALNPPKICHISHVFCTSLLKAHLSRISDAAGGIKEAEAEAN